MKNAWSSGVKICIQKSIKKMYIFNIQDCKLISCLFISEFEGDSAMCIYISFFREGKLMFPSVLAF